MANARGDQPDLLLLAMQNLTEEIVPLRSALSNIENELARVRLELASERDARILAEEEKRRAQDEIRILMAEIAALKARLGTDSTNSSKPPSSDGPAAKPRTRSQRNATGRKPGGQAGHAGATLKASANPDVAIPHRPAECGDCGTRFTKRQRPVAVEARQVFDLPERLRLQVTQHVLEALACRACHAVTKPAGPAEAARQVQYGPRAKALLVNLVHGQYVALDRAGELFEDLFGYRPNPATIQKMVEDAAKAINDRFRPVAVAILAGGHIGHVDETTLKVAGKKQ